MGNPGKQLSRLLAASLGLGTWVFGAQVPSPAWEILEYGNYLKAT